MAKVSYVDVIAGLEEKFWRSLSQADRFTFSRVRRNTSIVSRKKVKGLTRKSLLPQVADDWALLSEAQKQEWSDAAAEMNSRGWNLYVQDKCARIKNNMPGDSTPSLLHQSWIGKLHVGSPASEIKIVQLHPRAYWISKKVYGKKGMYVPVLVTEDFSLPLKISLSYSADLSAAGPAPSAKFYAEIWHSYQGSDIFTQNEISMDLTTGWKYDEATISVLAGYVVGYNLYIHLKDVTGDLLIDNIKSEHSGQNWVRNPWCKDINQGFTRAFYQVPKHWAGVIVPTGSWYESVFLDF